MRLKANAFAAVVLALFGLAPAQAVSPLDALPGLDTPHYTGGLTRGDRAVAQHIYVAMAPRYTAKCPPRGDYDGALVGYSDDRPKPAPPPPGTDPDLRALIAALDDPRQEIRDVAAYTIGLLGPAAKAALPAIEARFDKPNGKGGWYNIALEGLSCQEVVAPSYRNILPDEMLHPGDPPNDDLNAATLLLPKLYLDPDIEYPPGMMVEAYGEYRTASVAVAGVALLVQILDADGLSGQKRYEAAQVLSRIDARFLPPARAVLERAAQSNIAGIRYNASLSLVKLHDAAAVPSLIEQIGEKDWLGYWDDHLCALGPSAIAAQDRLLDVATHSPWPRVVRKAVKALACIGSVKALPVLTTMLVAPDWLLNIAAAKAIGALHRKDAGAEAILRKISQNHWSSKVRAAAAAALTGIGAAPPVPLPDTSEGGIQTVTIGGTPGPFDHGLPWCDSSGRYSIDGQNWFMVRWREFVLQQVPFGFPARRRIQNMGFQAFLRVEDGWLVGEDGFEHEGILAHVSQSGVVTDLDPGSPSIDAIVRTPGGIYAFGFEIAQVGDEGSLFRIDRQPGGKWLATRVLALPSPPGGYALSPDGTLLISDGPNDYAIVENQVVPMKCEKTGPGRYFDKYPENPYFDD